jgi:hypothetical protein
LTEEPDPRRAGYIHYLGLLAASNELRLKPL